MLTTNFNQQNTFARINASGMSCLSAQNALIGISCDFYKEHKEAQQGLLDIVQQIQGQTHLTDEAILGILTKMNACVHAYASGGKKLCDIVFCYHSSTPIEEFLDKLKELHLQYVVLHDYDYSQSIYKLEVPLTNLDVILYSECINQMQECAQELMNKEGNQGQNAQTGQQVCDYLSSIECDYTAGGGLAFKFDINERKQ